MTSYPPAGQKVTRNGQTLTARMWAMLEDSYRAAGLSTGYLEVSQGSYKNGSGASSSGSTHDKAGAADLRTSVLPSWARANLCESLVVELRRRGGCAWYRDEAHGGMAPHIHVILRDESPLSSGAAQQVRDYDAGKNGLSNGGKDYHPRPTQTPYRYPPATPATLEECDDMVIRYVEQGTGKTTFWLLSGGRLTSLSGADAGTWTGSRVDVTDPTTWDRITTGYPTNRG